MTSAAPPSEKSLVPPAASAPMVPVGSDQTLLWKRTFSLTGLRALAVDAERVGQRGQVAGDGVAAEGDVAAALHPEGGAHVVAGVADHEVVLDQDVLALEVGPARPRRSARSWSRVLPSQFRKTLRRTVMRSAPIWPSSSCVAVLHDDEGRRVVGVGPAAAREVVEEDVVLDDHVGDAVDVHVLVGAGLVVEDVALDRDAARAVVDLQDVVVPGVVEDVVAEDDVLRPVSSVRPSAPGPRARRRPARCAGTRSPRRPCCARRRAPARGCCSAAPRGRRSRPGRSWAR